MSKKFIILIIAIVLIILLVLGFSYLSREEVVKEGEPTGETNFLSNIFNFSSIVNNPVADLVDFIKGEDLNKGEEVKIKDKLNIVSSMPISGYGLYEKEEYEAVPEVDPNQINEVKNSEAPKTVLVSVLRYADKETGNIYQTSIKNIDERKFSNTIIPRIHESFFSKKNVIMRYLKGENTISTFLGELPEEILGSDISSNNEIFGKFLPDNINDISVSPNNENIFYLSNSKNGVLGNIINLKNEKSVVFDSAFTEWISFWPNNNFITLTTKASGFVKGYSYLLNPKTKDFTKILGEVKGLTTLLSEDMRTMLYSDSNLSLNLFDLNKNENRNLKIRTHSEKCIWSSDNIILYCAIPTNIQPGLIYPDAWYQGEANYVDEIWKINTLTGARNKLIDPKELYPLNDIDAINLKLDKEENTLFFMNKNDSYLWSLSLN